MVNDAADGNDPVSQGVAEGKTARMGRSQGDTFVIRHCDG